MSFSGAKSVLQRRGVTGALLKQSRQLAADRRRDDRIGSYPNMRTHSLIHSLRLCYLSHIGSVGFVLCAEWMAGWMDGCLHTQHTDCIRLCLHVRRVQPLHTTLPASRPGAGVCVCVCMLIGYLPDTD